MIVRLMQADLHYTQYKLVFTPFVGILWVVKLEVYSVPAHSNVSFIACRGHSLEGGVGQCAGATAVSHSDRDGEVPDMTGRVSDAPQGGALALQSLLAIH